MRSWTLLSVALTGLLLVSGCGRWRRDKCTRGHGALLRRDRLPRPPGRRGHTRGGTLIAACDAWNAMRTNRSYRSAMSLEAAREEITRGAGTQFDPACAAALLRHRRRARRSPGRRLTPRLELGQAAGRLRDVQAQARRVHPPLRSANAIAVAHGGVGERAAGVELDPAAPSNLGAQHPPPALHARLHARRAQP